MVLLMLCTLSRVLVFWLISGLQQSKTRPSLSYSSSSSSSEGFVVSMSAGDWLDSALKQSVTR